LGQNCTLFLFQTKCNFDPNFWSRNGSLKLRNGMPAALCYTLREYRVGQRQLNVCVTDGMNGVDGACRLRRGKNFLCTR